MDKNVAYIMLNAASMIGYYCEYIDYAWSMFGFNETLGSFWRYTARKNGVNLNLFDEDV